MSMDRLVGRELQRYSSVIGVARSLVDAEEPVTVKDVAMLAGCPETMARRALDELVTSGIAMFEVKLRPPQEERWRCRWK